MSVMEPDPPPLCPLCASDEVRWRHIEDYPYGEVAFWECEICGHQFGHE